MLRPTLSRQTETNMDQDPTVLLIDQDSTAIDSIRRVLGDQASRFKLRRVADVPTAVARIWGGGIDLVLLRLAGGANSVESAGSAENPLAPFRELQEKAQSIPLVIPPAKVSPGPRSSRARRLISCAKPVQRISSKYCTRLAGKPRPLPLLSGFSHPPEKAAKLSHSWAQRVASAQPLWP